MQKPIARAARLTLACVCSIWLSSAAPQEGYPLDGTWRGTWGPSDDPNGVVIVMRWNGETITGMINPGPDSYPFDEAALDAADWGVHISATTNEGAAVDIDGTLMDIGSYNRRIAGTWTQDGTRHPFEMVRE